MLWIWILFLLWICEYDGFFFGPCGAFRKFENGLTSTRQQQVRDDHKAEDGEVEEGSNSTSEASEDSDIEDEYDFLLSPAANEEQQTRHFTVGGIFIENCREII